MIKIVIKKIRWGKHRLADLASDEKTVCEKRRQNNRSTCRLERGKQKTEERWRRIRFTVWS